MGLSVMEANRVVSAMAPGQPDNPDGPKGSDSAEAMLAAEPFRILRPARQTLPFVFASPHSGRVYPSSLVAVSRLDALTLRRSEDAFVDELFGSVPALGAPLLTARFPRAYCDVNRAPGELDAGMFSGALNVAVDAPSARVLAGLGVIPRIVRDGAEIYRAKLAPTEARARLEKLYRPYHTALLALVEETIARFGAAIVIDCHSMPSALSVPDIVLGDRYGASAPAAVTAWCENAFSAAGFSIVRNSPYAGGYTTALYGRGPAGCHALQIEINRSLYLEEDSMSRRSAFDLIKQKLTNALTKLTALPLSTLTRRGGLPLAAE
jgi:N-formylglutamate amidohydrolase